MQLTLFFSQLQHKRAAPIWASTASNCRDTLTGRLSSSSLLAPGQYYGLHALRGGRFSFTPKVVLHFVHRELACLWISLLFTLWATRKAWDLQVIRQTRFDAKPNRKRESRADQSGCRVTKSAGNRSQDWECGRGGGYEDNEYHVRL